jgi:hypothetical protein
MLLRADYRRNRSSAFLRSTTTMPTATASPRRSAPYKPQVSILSSRPKKVWRRIHLHSGVRSS